MKTDISSKLLQHNIKRNEIKYNSMRSYYSLKFSVHDKVSSIAIDFHRCAQH